ncbi:MAG: SDR family oxidoreductase [Bacteroidota bacterium]
MVTFDFSGKAVLVTGASKGVGRATAMAFAQAGARICVHYGHDRAGGEQTLQQLDGAGHCLLGADLRKSKSAKQLLEAATTKLGRLDVLVNNAGQFVKHPVLDMPADEWLQIFQETIQLNLVAPAEACRTAARYWVDSGQTGVIVNVGSRGAYRGEAGQVGYGASKAGLHALSQSLAQELGPHGIRVHALAPGFIETAMARPHLQGQAGDAVRAQSPLNRVATTEEIARAILWLAAADAEWATGGIVDFNGASYLH